MVPIKRIFCGFVVACAIGTPTFAQDNAFADFEPVTDAMLADPNPADWLMFRRTYDGHGFSPLEQIDRENVGNLNFAWAWQMEPPFQESTPLVYDGIMYLVQTPDVIHALDATNGDLLWEYRRTAVGGEYCLPYTPGTVCPLGEEGYVPLRVSRNIAIYGDKIYHATSDNFLIALDARTGQMVWETQLRTADNWSYQSSGPIVANGLVHSGRACGHARDAGDSTGCFVSAHDAETGEEVWRFHTVPQPGEAGYDTWADLPNEARRHVGAWFPPTYDPELDLLYYGTSVVSPWPKIAVVGPEHIDDEFLYQTSTLAINATTGELEWYQQHIRDQWDHDHVSPRLLVGTAIDPNEEEVPWISPNIVPGAERQVVTGVLGKTGIFYSIDSETGEFLWARDTVPQNSVTDIDPLTGRATMNMELAPTVLGEPVPPVCPANWGGLNWSVGAYSPRTNAAYYPLLRLCNTGIMPGYEDAGTVQGYNVTTGEKLWEFETYDITASLLTTGGGLVFGGDLNRRFRAFDDETGEVLWETILSGPVGGTPVAYEVDGRQYVAVAAAGPYFTTLRSMNNLIGTNYQGGSTALFVFALPEN